MATTAPSEHTNPSEELMKKSILAFSLLALGSLQLQGAPCVNGSLSTLAALGNGGCELTLTSGISYNLNMFGFSAGIPPFTNYPGQVAQSMSNFNVTFALNPTNFAGGFSVSITPTVQNYFGFTAGATANGAQQFGMETTFRIAGPTPASATAIATTGNTGIGLITRIGGSIDNAFASAPVTGVPNPAVTLQKFIQQATNLTIQSILQPDTSSLPGSAFVVTPPTAFNQALFAQGVGALVIVDRLRLDGGNTVGSTASLTGYTNYFAPSAPQNAIPEPMTFALTGAGLIGLALLRRRK